jgi:hypothetical protein
MPALANTFLFVEPDDNYLNFASVPLHQIVEANKQAGQSITELMGSDANPARIKQELNSKSPLVCQLLGHGSPSVYTCQNLAPLLHAENSEELALMNERIMLLTSCLTAQQLGPALIDAGAVAYVGYQQEFWFYIGDSAGATRAVNSPFLAEFEFVKSLLHGKTTGEARAAQMAKYDEELAYWTTGEGKNHADASELAQILTLNKSICTFLGEASVSPSPQAGGLTAQINPAIPFVIATVALGYAIYKVA